MLKLCDAVCISPQGPGPGLMQKLALKSGFRSAYRLDEAALQGPLRFYLVDYRIADSSKEQILSHVRRSPSDNVRYAPVILIVGNCQEDALLNYSRYGFDDIVTLPKGAAALAERFEIQLGREHTYYETDSYFGPDRRRWVRSPGRPGARAASTHIEHHFTRDPYFGVRLRWRGIEPPQMTPGLLETMAQLHHART